MKVDQCHNIQNDCGLEMSFHIYNGTRRGRRESASKLYLAGQGRYHAQTLHCIRVSLKFPPVLLPEHISYPLPLHRQTHAPACPGRNFRSYTLSYNLEVRSTPSRGILSPRCVKWDNGIPGFGRKIQSRYKKALVPKKFGRRSLLSCESFRLEG